MTVSQLEEAMTVEEENDWLEYHQVLSEEREKASREMAASARSRR
jgi:hypothetical protein